MVVEDVQAPEGVDGQALEPDELPLPLVAEGALADLTAEGAEQGPLQIEDLYLEVGLVGDEELGAGDRQGDGEAQLSGADASVMASARTSL